VLIAKQLHRHFYFFSLRWLRKNVVVAYSFHHGAFFFPSRRIFLSTTVERKNPHGGKNNCWDRSRLATARKNDKIACEES